MTNDDGTYVLQTHGPEFRIAQLSGIEALYEELNTDTMMWTPNVKLAFEAFNKGTVFTNLTQAWDAATGLEAIKPTELGAVLVTDFSGTKFEEIKRSYEAQFPK